MSTPSERQSAILALLADQPRLEVAELAARFATSEDSVRRDLRALARSGRIRRVHGAVLPAMPAFLPYAQRSGTAAGAKAAIARAAVARLEAGMTLLLDAGTTTLAIAEAIPADLRLTVVTPSLPAALALADHPCVETIVTGGTVDPRSRGAVGAAALLQIQAVHADIAFIASCSLDAVAGLTTAGHAESFIKRAMIDAAAEAVAVATSDKLGTTAAHLVAPLRAVSLVITDPNAPPSLMEDIQKAGTDILIAES